MRGASPCVRAMTLLAGLVAVTGAIGAEELPAMAPTPLVLPLSAQVDGKGYAALTSAWWQWAMAMPIEPYLDPDGRFCDLGQEGSVWFLAGTDGSYDVERQCRVPADTHLLLPVINMMASTSLGAKQGTKARTCRELKASAAVNNDKLVSAVVLIDGVRVPDIASYRVRSEDCFKLFPHVPDDERFVTPTAASDGYWLLIRPLAPGRHTIVVGANYGASDSQLGQMVQNFEYVLFVGMGESSVEL